MDLQGLTPQSFADRSRPRRSDGLHPEPGRAAWHIGPAGRLVPRVLPGPRLRAVHPGGHRARRLDHPAAASPSAGARRSRPSTSPPTRCRSASSAAGSTTSSPPRSPTSARAGTRIGRFYIWEGGLGIWGAVALGALGRLDRLPPPRGARSSTSPTARPRASPWPRPSAAGATGSTTSSTAPHRPAVGPDHPRVGPERGPRGAGRQTATADRPRHLPADLPLRVALVPRRWRWLLVLADRRFDLRNGQLFALYIVGYPLGRVVFELMRSDDGQHDPGAAGQRVDVGPRVPARRALYRSGGSGTASCRKCTVRAEDGTSQHPEMSSAHMAGLRGLAAILPDAVANAVHARLGARLGVRTTHLHPKDGDRTCLPRASPPSPATPGLYRREHEHDACGVALVATMRGSAGHDIVDHALTALRNLDHRGATGADPLVGDGAGILTQIPDAFLREVVDFDLPPSAGRTPWASPSCRPTRPSGTPRSPRSRRSPPRRGCGSSAGATSRWRPSSSARSPATACRVFRQLFVSAAGSAGWSGIGLDRLAFCLRKRAEREAEVYFPSLSLRTLVYKGMLTTGQLEPFFPDLSDRRFATELALVHSRFSTNTFPSWPLAHPYRMIAHNGEINTVKGNRNWMRARESQLATDVIPGDLDRLFPICTPGGLRLGLLRRGARAAAPRRPLPAARGADDDPRGVGEPRPRWTRPGGPSTSSTRPSWSRGTAPPASPSPTASLIGAVLDRNGLRPGRYSVTDDGLVVLASEAGVLDLDPAPRGAQGAAPAGPHVPRGHRARPASSTTTRSSPRWPPSTPTRSGCTPA